MATMKELTYWQGEMERSSRAKALAEGRLNGAYQVYQDVRAMYDMAAHSGKYDALALEGMAEAVTVARTRWESLERDMLAACDAWKGTIRKADELGFFRVLTPAA